MGKKLVLTMVFMSIVSGRAQQSSVSPHAQGSLSIREAANLPNAPGVSLMNSEQSSSSQSSSSSNPQSSVTGSLPPQQTKRILGIIPNFRAVSSDAILPPQSIKQKFVTATQDSFDYSSVLLPAMLAAYSMATKATPEFHQGAAGYGRYFWHAAVDQTSENYMVEFVVPSILRQDTRYYTLGKGTFLKRAGYALSRAVITRSDSGAEVFNASEIIGAGAAAGLSSLYYPTRERSLSNTGKQWGLDVGIDAGTLLFKEFWPDINSKLFHQER
jgi:hypothetical protein